MSVTQVRTGDAPAAATDSTGVTDHSLEQPRDLQRTFQLVIATVWLLDAVLQLQPFMFTRGSNGFSGMLNNLAAGNPGWVARSITWNASNVYHDPAVTNSIFALVQFLIGFGIAWKRSLKPAGALHRLVHGRLVVRGRRREHLPRRGDPLRRWAWRRAHLCPAGGAARPSAGSDLPFVAARTVGVTAAKAIWAVVWGLLAVLAVVGSGRSPQALHDLVAAYTGQPGWLAHIDRATASMFLHHGTMAAILLAVVCVVVAIGVYLPSQLSKATLVLGMVTFVFIWVATRFGGILAGGATDPNSGPLVIILAMLYWPLTLARKAVTGRPSSSAVGSEEGLVQ